MLFETIAFAGNINVVASKTHDHFTASNSVDEEVVLCHVLTGEQ
jgi:hypothetical protein